MADSDDEFSLRTPSRKATGKTKRAKSGKSKRPSGEAEKPRAGRSSGKTKRPSGKTKRPSGATKRPSGKTKRPSGANKRPAKTLEDFDGPARSSQGGSKAVPLLVGALLVLGAGGGLLMLSREDAGERVVSQSGASQLIPQVSTGAVSVDRNPAVSALRPMNKQPGLANPTTVEELQPVAPEAASAVPTVDELAAMAALSSDHAMVARILEEFADLFELNLLANNPHAMAFEERQRREQELLQRLRELGLLAVPALQDMIVGLNNRAHQIFLAKALAGMDGEAARQAVAAILGENKDVALQTTLVRFLPEGDDTLPLLQAAYANEDNPNLRTMMLREVARRGAEDPDATAFFRQAAAEDGDVNVRAEAVTILGRRGDPEDQRLMEEIIRNEQNLQIRQRAIVAYAETGGASSLGYLEELARDTQQGLHVRASAVLAMGRVGGDQAIRALDMLGQSDPDQEIRTRATRLAHSLRARRDAANEPTVVDDEPIRVGLPPGQLERR